jgi:hypothetical protein
MTRRADLEMFFGITKQASSQDLRRRRNDDVDAGLYGERTEAPLFKLVF